MTSADHKSFSERDVCTKLITPALQQAGWDLLEQIREEVTLTQGRVFVRGKGMTMRGDRKRADYLLSYKHNLPLAVIEAKDNNHSVGAGMQQAIATGALIDVPFVYSSNGDAFLERDLSNPERVTEREIALNAFPSPEELWLRYCVGKGITPELKPLVEQSYYPSADRRQARYYQTIAINRTVEAIAKGQKRILLVMATGTGKTYTAFQIMWRLWKGKQAKHILFLADRNILIEQAHTNDFKPFGGAMTKIKKRQIDKSYEIYLALYQAITGNEEDKNIYKQFARDFFDLIVIDECHRGSAAEDSAWREVLEYFSSATQIGLTATPKETEAVSNIDYFGEPIYTYSLKQGIDDGFLAPYKVIKIDLDRDLDGWRPKLGQRDKYGNLIEDRVYNQRDFDKTLVIEERTLLVAQLVTDYLKSTDPYAKTIVFCEDIDHAERMRQALVNANGDRVKENAKYVMRITGDEKEGKAQLYNFINPEERYPVIVTTSELLTTGVDAKTCKLIVIDQVINSTPKFKQIVGRGTRIDEEHNKLFFTIMDFKKATIKFSNPEFDGDPVQIYEPQPDQPVSPPEPVNYDDDDFAENQRVSERRDRYVVAGESVDVVAIREQYLGKDGKLLTEAIRFKASQAIQGKYGTIASFLRRWQEMERKGAIATELEELGISVAMLENEVGQEFDLFDLICHVAFDQPPLTRRERAAQARTQMQKQNYFAKYGDRARQVLEKLLEKYADSGIEEIEKLDLLKVPPFTEFGKQLEIVRLFGGKQGYFQAIADLENALYQEVS